MIALVREGTVEEALALGVFDAAAVLHILRMPDPKARSRHALALAEELASSNGRCP